MKQSSIWCAGMKIATYANARTALEARKGVAPAFMTGASRGACHGVMCYYCTAALQYLDRDAGRLGNTENFFSLHHAMLQFRLTRNLPLVQCTPDHCSLMRFTCWSRLLKQ